MAICYSSGYVYCFSKQLNDNILAGAQPPFVYALLPRVYLNDSKGNHQGGPFNAFLCILFSCRVSDTPTQFSFHHTHFPYINQMMFKNTSILKNRFQRINYKIPQYYYQDNELFSS